jgi:hypothetical protein
MMVHHMMHSKLAVAKFWVLGQQRNVDPSLIWEDRVGTRRRRGLTRDRLTTSLPLTELVQHNTMVLHIERSRWNLLL